MFDIFDRLKGMVCLIAEKTWCGEQTREIEPADFVARFEKLSARAGDANPAYYVPVSYTHLDVYKRQGQSLCYRWHTGRGGPPELNKKEED